jgi:hypothetical protein
MPITVQHGPGPKGVATPALMQGLVQRYKEERARQDQFDMQNAQREHQLGMQQAGFEQQSTMQQAGFDQQGAMQDDRQEHDLGRLDVTMEHDEAMQERRAEMQQDAWYKQNGYVYTPEQENKRSKIREAMDAIKNDPNVMPEQREAGLAQYRQQLKDISPAQKIVSPEEFYKDNVRKDPEGNEFYVLDGKVIPYVHPLKVAKIKGDADLREKQEKEDKAAAADVAKQMNKLVETERKINQVEQEKLLEIQLEELEADALFGPGEKPGDDADEKAQADWAEAKSYYESTQKRLEAKRDSIRKHFDKQRDGVKYEMANLEAEANPDQVQSIEIGDEEAFDEATGLIVGGVYPNSVGIADVTMVSPAPAAAPALPPPFQPATAPAPEPVAIPPAPEPVEMPTFSEVRSNQSSVGTGPPKIYNDWIQPEKWEKPATTEIYKGINSDWTDERVLMYSLNLSDDTARRFLKWYVEGGAQSAVRGRERIEEGYAAPIGEGKGTDQPANNPFQYMRP